MLDQNSPMTDIALDAKETSNDVLQTTLAIEASVKHVDNTITNIPLSGTSEFIDNYPVPKPEVAEGFVGYAVDTSKNEYDVTNIYEKQVYPPAQEDFFQYNGQVSMTEPWTDIEMFNNSINVQRNGRTLSFSTPNGVESKRVDVVFDTQYKFMFHGYYDGYQDLYMLGFPYESTNASYRIYCYDDQGIRVKIVNLRTKYPMYKGFCFDGVNFYSLSVRNFVTYIGKYDLDGTLVGEVSIPSDSTTPIHIISTNNCLLCLSNSLSSSSVVFDKDLKFISNIDRPTPVSGILSKIVPLWGFDCVYACYANNYVVYFDLVNKTNEIPSSGDNNSYISYFGSTCLLVRSRIFRKLDHNGKSFSITKPNTPNVFQGLASNGSMIMGILNYNGFSYSDLADKELACIAKKRG